WCRAARSRSYGWPGRRRAGALAARSSCRAGARQRPSWGEGMTKRAQQVGVIGAGAWGTALALVAARAGHQVILWAREPETSREINATRENKARLPDIRLPEEISATSAPEDLSVCDLIMIATPAQAMRVVMERFRPHLQ